MDVSNMKVYVISNEDYPLRPCSPAIARFLLKIKRAEVVRAVHNQIKL